MFVVALSLYFQVVMEFFENEGGLKMKHMGWPADVYIWFA